MTTYSHGGKRPGSGTKKGQILVPPELKKVGVYVKLPKWIVDWLGTHKGHRPALIEDALCKVHKLTPPQDHAALQHCRGERREAKAGRP